MNRAVVSGANGRARPAMPPRDGLKVTSQMPAPLDMAAMDESAEQFAQAPQAPATTRAEHLLLEFLREHEAPCPVCGYNLKALTRPVCPECGQELVLAVGAARLRFGWLFAAVAPGFFSGIAAIFLLVPIVGITVFGNGKLPLLFIAVDAFGWCSGVSAITLAANRHRFVAQPVARQRWWALGIWLTHVAALALFLGIAFRIL
jgi:hypothetical protein